LKTVLIVSPHFPPINAADCHRVRATAPYFREFGWEPVILAVRPEFVEGVREPLLEESFPPEIPVVRAPAFRTAWTRRLGLGNLGLRSLPFLYRAGCKLIRQRKVDLVYFSTTVFTVMPLGRLWKRRFGTRYVLDMQDPWVSDYYVSHKAHRPPKYWAAAPLHRVLEPWTMRAADGLIAVSQSYIQTLQERYPWLADRPNRTLPFGAAERDFDVIRKRPQPNRFFDRSDGAIHGVYVGRGGHDMQFALRIVFGAMRAGLRSMPERFAKVRLHFVGTDYADDRRARKTVEPVAEEFGVAGRVEEHPGRVPYFEGLQLLLDADFLLIPGSDDPQYTASKIYPYILSGKPMFAVFHRLSSVCEIMNRTGAGDVVAFDPDEPPAAQVTTLTQLWSALLARVPFTPAVNGPAFEPYAARAMACAQCEIFDQAVRSA
jgi:hypothetical protein